MSARDRRRRDERKRKGCTEKVRYRTQIEAMRAGAKVGLNWYRCRWCHGYHLTSRNTSKANHGR